MAASAVSAPPESIDCAAMPCAEMVPGAVSFAPVEGATYLEAHDADGDLVGWLALSTDFVEIKAYSGKPMVTLVGLDAEGIITGARVVHHNEPILLVGIPEQSLHDFVDFYAGHSALKRIVVGRASHEDALSVDAISGATVTVLAQNQTVLETARALGSAVGVFNIAQIRGGHFVSEPEPWTFAQLVEGGVLGHMVVSMEQIGMEADSGAAVDLHFGVIDPEHIGRGLLGDRDYSYRMGKLEEGEHLFIVVNQGDYSFKGSAFVRGGIFDRIRLQQGLREITFRDTDYWNLSDLAGEDAPEITEGALFVVRDGRLDPGDSFELVFLSSKYDQRGAFTREFHEFTQTHALPDGLWIQDAPVVSGIPWRQAWRNRVPEVVVLCLYLTFVTGVFVARRYTTADPKRIERLHLASLIIGFLAVGVWMRAQPSVTQILTAIGSVIDEWRWSLFLSEPGIFILWSFAMTVSLIWGRGVFCGWVCPYGAMTELAFKITRAFGWESLELPDRIHSKLIYLRYVILFALIGTFLWDAILAEQLAEIEPFKSTFFVPAWTRHWGFLAWWIALLAISFVSFRPFCRYICPLGGGLALMSSFRPSGPRRRQFCSSCTICTRGCEPRAIGPDGVIDPRECLSCMDCEATYRNETVCPPLVGISRLSVRDELTAKQEAKLEALRADSRDV